MIKLNNFIGCAPKLSGFGCIKYAIWVSQSGKVHVQIIRNEVDGKSLGSFSDFLFDVEDYSKSKNKQTEDLYGISATPPHNRVKSKNNNDKGLLKAVIIHLNNSFLGKE